MAKNSEQDISILSNGIKFEGKLAGTGSLRLDGEFDGELKIDGNLTLGDNSISNGLLHAQNITCNGKVKGTMIALEKLILEANASVEGDISAKILVINEGAAFIGKSNMNKEGEENNKPEYEQETE
jgi:cytoskeletal protein CcmA (bactofilin family)